MTDEREKGRTVLIVDDTPENIDILKGILKDQYVIKVATRGAKALEIARTTPVDLILLDIMMPEMDGLEVCRALKADEATKRIPVIFVTALKESDDEARGLEAGAVDYITKPVNAAVVQARVRTHLALKENQDALEEWNSNLKKRLLQSVTTIREKTQALMSAEEHAAELSWYSKAVELLSGVFEMMENRHGVHARAVSELAGDAARKMNLDAKMVAKVRLAGLLHDVGKLGTGRGTTEKRETDKTSNELSEYQSHSVRGQDVFSSLEELHDVGLMVRGHHETYKGSGFPDGLKGDDIPLGARLVAIADFLECAASAVSGERAEYALMKARLHAGTLLDPKLIAYFSGITRILYFETKKPNTSKEVEVAPAELFSGLVLSRDVISTTGVLLLRKGGKLDLAGISLIRQDSRMRPPSERGVWVYVDSAEH
ncbi:response regulator [Pelotalea chapellei]|uniref:Response regulator n=1 Tax=Pelotalea chapellei TaxID=44671 RepID=A0ABS5UCI4_9BACT|nr:HD domain-containing phosphohydrolase [Pelotalea chapellei]MBT1073397.1 response regulator [Pelotalea chapellei]